jgi:hypothetical protein
MKEIKSRLHIYFKESRDQLNLLYIWICLYLQRIKVIGMRANEPYYGLRPLSIPEGYCFMILFFRVYIVKHFLLLVPFSHQRSTIMFSF